MERKYNQGVADANRRRTKHGGTVNARQGGTNPLYKVWVGIKDRCFNPQAEHYARYGGRGITMCEAWVHSFSVFLADVGEQPRGMTLERVENNGNYEPNNVRWATRKEQANNRINNVVISHSGLTMTLSQWAEHLGWKYGLIGSRWKKGLRGDELFTEPLRNRNALVQYRGQFKTLSEWAKESGVPYVTLHWRLNNGKELF